MADRLLELRADDLEERRPGADVIALAMAEQPGLMLRAAAAARGVLMPLRGELVRLEIERRVDELSVRAEVRVDDATRIARVGVRAP